MNQSINTDSKNSKEPQQKYRLGTVSIKTSGSELSVFKPSWCKMLRCEMPGSEMVRVRIGNLEVRNVMVLWCPAPKCPGAKWFMSEKPCSIHPDAYSPGLKHLGAWMSGSYPYSYICQFHLNLIHTTDNSTKTNSSHTHPPIDICILPAPIHQTQLLFHTPPQSHNHLPHPTGTIIGMT